MPAAMRIALIGGGKMGEAILAGWLAAQEGPAASLAAESFTVVNPGRERRDHLKDAYGVACCADAAELAAAEPFDMAVLAVKPQVMTEVLPVLSSLAPFQGGPAGPLFVSIAAGITTDALAQGLPAAAPVVRVMPNTPLQVGAGASAVCGGACADSAQVGFVRELFGCLGCAVEVDESQMDAVCALSGSGPAYVAAMIEALTAAAAEEGLPAALAQKLAVQTVLGTASLIDATGISPRDARLAVCSPGGTTLAALEAMDEAGFSQVFAAGVHAAARRSKELAQCMR